MKKHKKVITTSYENMSYSSILVVQGKETKGLASSVSKCSGLQYNSISLGGTCLQNWTKRNQLYQSLLIDLPSPVSERGKLVKISWFLFVCFAWKLQHKSHKSYIKPFFSWTLISTASKSLLKEDNIHSEVFHLKYI